MARSRGQQLVIKQMPLRREMSLGSGRGSATSCGTPISLSFSFLAGKGSRDARPPKGSWFLSKLHVTRVLSGKQDTRDRSVRSSPGSAPGSCSVCRGRPGEPRTPPWRGSHPTTAWVRASRRRVMVTPLASGVTSSGLFSLVPVFTPCGQHGDVAPAPQER